MKNTENHLPEIQKEDQSNENQSFVKFLLLFLLIIGAVCALVDYLFL